MKIARTIGLAAIAALALIAFAGASSALAAGDTVLCKSAGELPYCENEENRYPAETSFEAKVPTGKLFVIVGKNPNVTVMCEQATIAGETTSEADDPLSISLSSWTLSKCGTSSAHKECTATSEGTAKGNSLLWSSGADGVLSLGAESPQLWKIKCTVLGITMLDCTYKAQAETSLKGGSPAQFDIGGSLSTAGGSKCPETNTITSAHYELTSPKPAYVASDQPGTELCAGEEQPCEGENRYPAGTDLEAELQPGTNFTIDASPLPNFVCATGSMTLDTKAAIGEPLPVDAKSFPLGNCTTWGSAPCTVTTTIHAATEGFQPGIEWVPSWFQGNLENLTVSWRFDCVIGGLAKDWTFEARHASAVFTEPILELGGPVINFEGVPGIKCTGKWCPTEEGEITAGKFVVTSPAPLYVTHRE